MPPIKNTTFQIVIEPYEPLLAPKWRDLKTLIDGEKLVKYRRDIANEIISKINRHVDDIDDIRLVADDSELKCPHCGYSITNEDFNPSEDNPANMHYDCCGAEEPKEASNA
jgi:hypothetical protein